MYKTSLKNMEVIAIKSSLEGILEQEMDIGLWDRLSEIILVIEKRLQDYDAKIKMLMNKYVKQNDNGKFKFTVQDNRRKLAFKDAESEAKYMANKEAILQQDVELAFPVKVEFKDLLREKIKISGRDVINVKSFLSSLEEE